MKQFRMMSRKKATTTASSEQKNSMCSSNEQTLKMVWWIFGWWKLSFSNEWTSEKRCKHSTENKTKNVGWMKILLNRFAKLSDNEQKMSIFRISNSFVFQLIFLFSFVAISVFSFIFKGKCQIPSLCFSVLPKKNKIILPFVRRWNYWVL